MQRKSKIHNLAAFTKPKKLKIISRFDSLILVENEKDKKIYHITEVSSKNLVKNVKRLSSLNLINGLEIIFTSKNKDYAKLALDENLFNLKILQRDQFSLSESQISALTNSIFEAKALLLENGLIEMVISPDFCFIDKAGNFIPLVLKMHGENEIKNSGLNLFKDIFEIFFNISDFGTESILRIKNPKNFIEDFMFSDCFKNFFVEFYLLFQSEIDFRNWKKLRDHRFLKTRFKKKKLKSVYQLIQSKIENFAILHQKLGIKESISIIPEEIKWRLQIEKNPKKSIILTSDSSGGSNSKESQMIKPCLGGQASLSMQNIENSQLFLKSCEEIIEKMIEKVKRESSSSFLINSLRNLLETLKGCEIEDPNKTILMLKGILGDGLITPEEIISKKLEI